MVSSIDFIVPGVPVPKARPRLGKNGAYTPDKTRLYERKGAYHAREAMAGNPPVSCSVFVDLDIFMPIPESFGKLKREKALEGIVRPIGKIDVDNVAKAILDHMNKIVYIDDNQVCELSASMFYGDNPRVQVRVSW